ncbi:MAG TPA: DinB family protein [Gemmatimonadales bacterium]|jgi:uncharacterized damage-inducible protein DinB|nr:DinB family protein [Gemmatimonadales bacterium]
MTARSFTLIALGAMPAIALAQGSATPASPAAGFAVASVQPLYEMSRNWLIKSAEQIPEADYAFKPTPEVRSFGQLIGHLANANYMFCSAALGEKSPAMQDFEKTTEKAALVKAIKDAFAYCDGAYRMTDEKAAGPAELPMENMKGSKLWVLAFNVSHNNEHYGNLVTYFRLKKMVPPSSQPGS